MVGMSFQTDTRLSRQRQITTLKVFNSSVEEVVEGTEYKVGFRAGHLDLELVVVLPQEFPSTSPPLVFVKPPVHHPWVQASNGQVTAAPGLSNFTPHSDLGMVVTAIRREMEKTENLVVCQQPQQVVPAPNQKQVDHTPSNDPVRHKLSSLTRDELLELLDKEEAMDRFMMELEYPPLDTMKDNIKSMEENIQSVAESNIALQSQIETARDSLLCKVEQFHARREELVEVYDKTRELENRVSGVVLADKLVRLSVSNEELSDGIADKFLSKQLQVDTFLTEYINTRQKCHLQKFKADKVKQL